MKRPYDNMRFLLPLIAAFALANYCTGAFAQTTTVDLILDNGTVLIYKARAAGYEEGQKLNVIRGGAVVGTVEVIEMRPTYARAKIVTGAEAIRELDAVMPVGETLKVNLKYENGTILIYKTRETGYEDGQKLNVMRGGAVVGIVEIIETQPAYAWARIITGADAIRELDAVMPVRETPKTEAAKPSGGSTKTRAVSQDEGAAAPNKSGGGADSPEAASSSRSTAAKDETTTSSRSSNRRSSGEASSAKATPSAKTSRAVQPHFPAAISKKPPYVIHVGYFYLNQNIPGDDANIDPALMFGIDFWKPKKEWDNKSLVFGLMYSRPEAKYESGDRRIRSIFKILQLQINYIWTDLYSKHSDGTGLYGGVGAGYRTASMQTSCEGACDDVSQPTRNTLDDMDYHGILGYRFHNRYELKFDYSFDEEYYGVTLGFVGKAKSVSAPAKKIEAEPEPEPVVEEEPEPEPEPEIVEEPEPEPVIEEKPAPKAIEPVVILVSEPEVEKKIYYYAVQPAIEKKVIILALEDINFEFDSSTLTNEARVILKRNVQILRENPTAQVRIAGYTSASGTNEYNQKLSERRANAVKDYLVKEGLIAADRLATIGYGEANPETYEVAPKNLYSPAAKSNMRVLFEIIIK